MISPELVRRYPFFSTLNDQELKAVAMLGEALTIAPGEDVLVSGAPADWFYLLADGAVDLYLVIENEPPAQTRQEHFIGEVSPGEAFGVSAIVEGGSYKLTARTAAPSRFVRFDAHGLRELAETDDHFAAHLFRRAALIALQRLRNAHIGLAAAWA